MLTYLFLFIYGVLLAQYCMPFPIVAFSRCILVRKIDRAPFYQSSRYCSSKPLPDHIFDDNLNNKSITNTTDTLQLSLSSRSTSDTLHSDSNLPSLSTNNNHSTSSSSAVAERPSKKQPNNNNYHYNKNKNKNYLPNNNNNNIKANKTVLPNDVQKKRVVNELLLDQSFMQSVIEEWNKPLPIEYILTRPIVLAGPSGVGKNALIRAITNEYGKFFERVITHTTRSPRTGEINGTHYHFITLESCQQLLQSLSNSSTATTAKPFFMEHRQVHNNYYGVSYAAYEEVTITHKKIPILEIDIQGLLTIQAKIAPVYQWQPYYLFIEPPHLQRLQDRLIKRGSETEETINLRIENAKEEIRIAREQHHRFNKILVNGEFQTSKEKLLSYLQEWYPLPSITNLQLLQKQLLRMKNTVKALQRAERKQQNKNASSKSSNNNTTAKSTSKKSSINNNNKKNNSSRDSLSKQNQSSSQRVSLPASAVVVSSSAVSSDVSSQLPSPKVTISSTFTLDEKSSREEEEKKKDRAISVQVKETDDSGSKSSQSSIGDQTSTNVVEEEEIDLSAVA